MRQRSFIRFLEIRKENVRDYQRTLNTREKERPTTITDFEILKVIGKGTFGKVLQVQHKETGDIFAVKVLKKKSLEKKHMVRNTKTERRILESINHPFIVSLKYAFQTADKLYLVLDYFTGGELFFHLNKERFTIDRARIYCAELVLALGCLHENGIIYRDLKPENILLDEDGHVRLCDFGLSKDELPADGQTQTFCGTPHYLAPEVINRESYGKEVDWWSLGTLLFEMLTGLPPFYDSNINKMYVKICTNELKLPAGMSPACKSLLRGLLEKNPRKRLGFKGVDEIKNNAFFANIDWDKLYKKVRRLALPYTVEFEVSIFTNVPIVAVLGNDCHFQTNGKRRETRHI